MKIRKKVTVGVVGVLMSLVLCAGSANAAFSCNAVISKPGIQPAITGTPETTADDYSLYVQCPTWPSARRMFLSSDLGESGYATVLTAISLDKEANLTMVAATWNSIITDIYILP